MAKYYISYGAAAPVFDVWHPETSDGTLFSLPDNK